jgi:hydrogenase expression/formation protein
MLDRLQIDYLGVSLDALLVVAPGKEADRIIDVVGDAGVPMEIIGRVEKGTPAAVLVVDGREEDFTPRFRESAYTPLKKVVDRAGRDFDEMKTGVDRAAAAAVEKKRRVLSRITGSGRR